MPLETQTASIIDQMYKIGHNTTETIRGNWIINQSNAFLCSRLKCCPRYRKGTKDRMIVNQGLTAPQGPTPPLNSVQISESTPKGVDFSPSSTSSSTTNSSVTDYGVQPYRWIWRIYDKNLSKKICILLFYNFLYYINNNFQTIHWALHQNSLSIHLLFL